MDNFTKEYPDYTRDFDDVLKAEDDYLVARRKSLGLDDQAIRKGVEKIEKTQDEKYGNKWRYKGGRIGLALSGGGIRSATFNLGLLQAMAKVNLLRLCDYLSTVSGGGYIGCCLSSLLANPEASVEFEKFPFRFQKEDKADERQEVKWLRIQSLKYNFIGSMRLPCLYISGYVLTNLTILYVVILLSYGLYLVVNSINEPLKTAMLLFRGSFLLFLIIILIRWLATLPKLNYKSRLMHANILVGLTLTAATLLVFGSFIILASSLPEFALEHYQTTSLLLNTGVVTSGFGLLIGFLKGKKDLVKKFRNLIFWTASVAVLPILLVSLIWTLKLFEMRMFEMPALILLAAVLFTLSLFTNIDRLSMHHFYRDKLSKVYIVRRDERSRFTDDEEFDGIKSNEDLKIADLHSQKNGAPYHLINATLNVPRSKDRYLRGRGADFFVFSRLYCGSDSTGYRQTKNYDNGETRLATAMAISGVTASLEGDEKFPAVMRFVKMLLNIRLNCFMPNPNPARKANFIFWPYYFLKELLGAGKENDRLLNLSDGGHHENLGIYQLIKRRCQIIVASDVSADPHSAFFDFANLQKKVRIDFGVEIKIDLNVFRLDPVRWTSGGYYVVGTIEYPDAPAGLLVFIKSAIIGNEPEDILAYRRAHPTFPNEATTDQFFDEAQFESYRALGYLIGKLVFS